MQLFSFTLEIGQYFLLDILSYISFTSIFLFEKVTKVTKGDLLSPSTRTLKCFTLKLNNFLFPFQVENLFFSSFQLYLISIMHFASWIPFVPAGRDTGNSKTVFHTCGRMNSQTTVSDFSALEQNCDSVTWCVSWHSGKGYLCLPKPIWLNPTVWEDLCLVLASWYDKLERIQSLFTRRDFFHSDTLF